MKLNYNPIDLVYHFDFVDAVQIQQILFALKNGYELRKINSSSGVVEFVFSKGVAND